MELFIKNTELRQQTLHVVLAFGLIVVAGLWFEGTTMGTWLWGLAFIIGGYHKAIEGFEKTIENKSLNVEFLMILAAFAAFLTQDYEEGAVLIFIFAVSGVLEYYANLKSERALTKLLELSPKTAIKLVNAYEIEVNVDDLRVHDVVVVKVGQHIPADGVVIKGQALINQAPITGEFIPVSKGIGDAVYAGSLNEDATLWVEVLKDPKASTVQKIIEFVQQAQANQTRSQTLIERFEMWYVYVVILLALVFFIVPYAMGWLSLQDALYRGVIVLVVGSPCAVVASITPAILSSLSYGASHGILIKGGSYLETLGKVSAIVFDKTGTITTGKPQVHQLHIFDETQHTHILETVVNIERQSHHPLAQAISDHYHDVKRVSLETNEVPGQGLSAFFEGHQWFVGRRPNQNPIHQKELQMAIDAGNTLVEIYRDDRLVGFIALKDTLREEAPHVMKQLHARNIKTILLTGDIEPAARAIGQAAGIQTVIAQCMPQDKVREVEHLKRQGETVLMIGDGINDAPSLALADVGAAVGNATDVTLETADVIFIQNNLSQILNVINLSKRMAVIVKQNLIFSISVIVVLLLSNIGGWIALPGGVLAHEGSTILVILNSLRLLRHKEAYLR